MKYLFVSATALAAASLFAPAAAIAGRDKPAMPAKTEALAAPPPTASEEAPMQSAPASEPATATPADPAAILRKEFPTFDADKSGELNTAEFAAWMEALRKNSPGEPMTAEQQAAWVKQSFAQAETSKNGTLDLDELTKFMVNS